MSATDATTAVFLCECGPIIRDLVDLDAVAARVAELPSVASVERYATLCSDDGKSWLAQRLREHPERRVVIAGCSPREHAATFAGVCRDAGANAYLIARANLREQCGWVTPDRDAATAKACELVAAAVSRVREQQPLEDHELEVNADAMVIGAGTTGMSAALMLADAGRHVVLVERDPAIGGKVVLFGEAYPDMECASCMLEPLMDHVLHHPDIDVLTMSEVEEVLGYLGNYTVRVRTHPRHVDAAGCYGCRSCAEACPVEVPDPYEAGLATCKAIRIPYAGALPNASMIDEHACQHFAGGECSACVEACPFGNIDLAEEERVSEWSVGSIIVATGAELEKSQGEGSAFALPAVLDTYAFERILNSDGPTGGEIRLPDDVAPHRIALVHCAEASGHAPSGTCSRTCCMSLAKYALEIRHRLPDAAVFEFVWDRCAGGKGYREFTQSAGSWDGITEIRLKDGETVEIQGDPSVHGARVVYVRDGVAQHMDVDLVVMAPPQRGSSGIDRLAAILGLDTDERGFLLEQHDKLKPFYSRIEGVLIAGTAQGPKDIQDAVAQGAAAAGAALSALVPGRTLVREPITSAVDPDVCGGCRICTLLCPYKAITFDAERKVAEINELLCHGCGACAAACPSSAIDARNFTDRQLQAEIGSFCGTGPVTGAATY